MSLSQRASRLLLPDFSRRPSDGRAELRGALARSHYVTLDTPLLQLAGKDAWSVGDAQEHLLALGQSGSGKSSSLQLLAKAMLRAGFGGLVLCAKPDEADRWERLAKECGRDRSVIRMDASGKFLFGFLSFLMARTAEEGGGVDNAVSSLLHIIEASSVGRGEQRADFWMKAVRELLSNSIAALWHAWGRVILDELLQLVTTVPVSAEQMQDEKWKGQSFCYQTLQRLYRDPARPIEAREAEQILTYFTRTLATLDGKTRSNILISLTAELSPLMKGPLHRLFGTGTNVIPEMTHEGVIWVVDLPVKRFEHTGIVAQKLVKYLWQKATERRHVDAQTRPVFLWADECQFFVSEYDLEFLSTARSSRAATVYITQNLPTLYAQIGGERPQDTVDALVGLFGTKVFFSNTDARTNQMAADIIGKAVQRRRNQSWGRNYGESISRGSSENWNRGQSDSDSHSFNQGRSDSYTVSKTPGAPGGLSFSYGMSSNHGTSTSRSRSWSSSKGGGTTEGTSLSEGGNLGAGWSEQIDYVVQPSFFANGLRQGGLRNDFTVTGVLLQANRVFARTGTCFLECAFRQK